MSKDKIEKIKNEINKKFKEKVLQTYDEKDDLSIQRLSSGILSLDLILGRGSNGAGWPVGRVSEIFGPEAGGKSSITISTIASAQRQGIICVLVDAEHSFNADYARSLGVNIDELLLCQPYSAEEGYDVVEDAVSTGLVGLVIIDSVAAMVPNVVVEASFGDQQMGVGARLNNKFVNVIVPLLNKHDVTLLLVNQLREKIGGYGLSEYAPGGKGIKFAASVRLEVRRGESVTVNGNDIGHIVKCKTVKNKTFAPNKTTELRLDWGKGFNHSYCLFKQGVLRDVISTAGSWIYTIIDKEKYHGKDNIIERLETDKDFANAIAAKIMEANV